MKDNSVNIPLWFPIVTLVIGSFLTTVTDLFKDKRQDNREEKMEYKERRRKIEERRTNFQRETLLALQELLFSLIRVTDSVYKYYETNGWGNLSIESDLSTEFQEIESKISIYRVRILDDDLRKLVNQMQKAALDVLFSKEQTHARKSSTSMSELFSKANEKLGVLLRTLY